MRAKVEMEPDLCPRSISDKWLAAIPVLSERSRRVKPRSFRKAEDRALTANDVRSNLVGDTAAIFRFESCQPVLKFAIVFEQSLILRLCKRDCFCSSHKLPSHDQLKNDHGAVIFNVEDDSITAHSETSVLPASQHDHLPRKRSWVDCILLNFGDDSLAILCVQAAHISDRSGPPLNVHLLVHTESCSHMANNPSKEVVTGRLQNSGSIPDSRSKRYGARSHIC